MKKPNFLTLLGISSLIISCFMNYTTYIKANEGLVSRGKIIYDNSNTAETDVVLDSKDHEYLRNNILANSMDINALEDDFTKVSDQIGEDANGISIHEKLDLILESGGLGTDNSGEDYVQLALVSTSKTFNITNIVGEDNLAKYSINDFVIVGNFVDANERVSKNVGIVANDNHGYWFNGYTRNIQGFTTNYNHVTGEVTITGGINRVGCRRYHSPDGTLGFDEYYDIEVPVQVYMIIKTPNANIPSL